MISRLLKTALVLVLSIVAPLPSLAVAPAVAPVVAPAVPPRAPTRRVPATPATSTVAAAGAATAAEGGSWPMPRWARAPQTSELRKQQRENARDVGRANRTTAASPDLVLYGDGFARMLQTTLRPLFDVFVKKGLVLGVDNCTVECLFWRMRAGGERLRRAPRTVAIQVGAQNLADGTSPLDNLDYLLKYAKSKDRNVVLLGLLPMRGKDVASVNAKYEDLARKLDVRYIRCGTTLDVANPLFFQADGRPTALTDAYVLACLLDRVAGSSRPPSPPTPVSGPAPPIPSPVARAP